MNNRELKNKILSSFSEETPDLLPKIENSINSEAQTGAVLTLPERKKEKKSFFDPAMFKRLAVCAVCILMLATGFSVGLLIPERQPVRLTDTTVYLDVNPSVELCLDEGGEVVTVVGVNEDARELIGELELSGVKMKTAISAIVGAMYMGGYLSEDNNSILVSVDKSGEDGEAMLGDITDGLNKLFEGSGMDCSVIAQSIEVTEQTKERAESLGVSAGKLFLVDKMIEKMDGLSLDNESSLAALSIGELSFMYSDARDKDSSIFDGDVTSGKVHGFIDREGAFDGLLTDLDLELSFLEEYSLELIYEEIDGAMSPVYSFRIVLLKNLGSYSFKVDCRTGKVIERDLELDLPFGDLFK